MLIPVRRYDKYRLDFVFGIVSDPCVQRNAHGYGIFCYLPEHIKALHIQSWLSVLEASCSAIILRKEDVVEKINIASSCFCRAVCIYVGYREESSQIGRFRRIDKVSLIVYIISINKQVDYYKSCLLSDWAISDRSLVWRKESILVFKTMSENSLLPSLSLNNSQIGMPPWLSACS